MNNDSIATTGKKPGPFRVPLKRAGTTPESAPVLLVRRLKDSDRNRAALAAKYVEGQTYTERMYSEYLVRLSVIGAERLTDYEDGTAVEFKPVTHGELGSIASIDVYNALSFEDLAEISKAMKSREQLAEADKGN